MINAIEVKNLGKRYTLSHDKEALVRYILPGLKVKTKEEFWALRDINVEVGEGGCLGVVGKNGAGKSTFLSILAGITFPTLGLVKSSGKIATILNLDGGFNPELTGEENIYLSASIFGLMPKEIKDKFRAIVDFAEIGNFIDAPLKTYSSGMCMRLGFAVAVHADFDILLIDEVLTVGDLGFQEKCLKKLVDFRKAGKALVLISQATPLIEELCDSVIVLEKGRINFRGNPQEALSRYRNASSFSSAAPDGQKTDEHVKDTRFYWGTKSGKGGISIERVRFFGPGGKKVLFFETGDTFKARVEFIVHKAVTDPHFGIAIFKEDGTYCYGPNTRFDNINFPILNPGRGSFDFDCDEFNLLPGKYRISVAIWEKDEQFAYDYHNACYEIEVVSGRKDHGIVYLKHKWNFKLP